MTLTFQCCRLPKKATEYPLDDAYAPDLRNAPKVDFTA
jgi:hypothetical protein